MKPSTSVSTRSDASDISAASVPSPNAEDVFSSPPSPLDEWKKSHPREVCELREYTDEQVDFFHSEDWLSPIAEGPFSATSEDLCELLENNYIARLGKIEEMHRKGLLTTLSPDFIEEEIFPELFTE